MATSSMSSARLAPSITSVTSQTRLDVSSTYLGPRLKISSTRAIRYHENYLRRSGYSAFAGRSAERWPKPICITNFDGMGSLRFHPACFYRPTVGAETQRGPALIGVVTDLDNTVTGVHRTWLDPDLVAPDHGKAPIESPKRSLGDIWTHAVRFGIVDDVMAAGEGIETILSVRSALPALPMIAALSASHLAAVAFPRRVPSPLAPLYIASDADPAGKRAASALATRACEVGIEAIVLLPMRNDFNDDLIAMGVDGLRAALGPQLAPGDLSRFMSL